MLSRPTTFVIGAGASVPYGFPDGSALYQQAINIDANESAFTVLQEYMADDACHLYQLLADLKGENSRSLDGYLQARPGDRLADRFGRGLIALLIGQCHLDGQQNPPTPRPEDDWLDGVLTTMCLDTTLERFNDDNANVHFVTFNFEHTIGEACRRVLAREFVPKLRHGLEREFVDPLIQRMSTTFVHGRLPSFEGLHPFWLPRAADELKIVSDNPAEPALLAAQKAFRGAEVICFLGFGFHPDNLAKLRLHERLREGAPCEVYASGHGLHAQRRDAIAGQLERPITFGTPAESCREFLERTGLIAAWF